MSAVLVVAGAQIQNVRPKEGPSVISERERSDGMMPRRCQEQLKLSFRSCAGGCPFDVILVCLQSAAEHDRLASNTYRRLNLGLVGWAAINLWLLVKETSALTTWCLRSALHSWDANL
jgi:hypothetical protein